MDIRPFRIERYYARYEFTTRYMLSSSDCESRAIADLLELEPDAHARLLGTWCGYTESAGAPELRQAIAALYERIDPDEVIVTSCAEEGILLVYHALLGAGDHAIVEAPCYESALELARSTGARVSQWRRSFEEGWAHDLDALEGLVRRDSRVLYVNQPHNPTGTLMDRPTFERVAELARANRLVLFSDEVYRELEHDPADRLPAACDLDERAVSLGSISKGYGLPGLRLGWLATRDAPQREAIMRLKDYTTICSSAPSEVLTALALRNRHVLLERNRRLVQRNLPLLGAFFNRHAETFEWIRPVAGPIGFPRVTAVADVDRFCERLAGAGVLLLPGSVYDEPAHVRVGFGRANLPEALAVLESTLAAPAAV
ncbi:MAG: aminotransferase class I/II-fold pyridoxal phosphate-dependent enzyme [Solirubrobacterales bacterium]|nr:aminotransferase class I/II-fold pyridoxal phosphate-dependent enzyme [Solirubrobacterales bacterium]MBV9805757.1 aminotransferase class I/II-fold pyridoxal phosphate-dependent enzyme [Solirubrobacterales bacterium]